MKAFGIGLVVAIAAALLARSLRGGELGNDIRWLTDRAMLGFLRLTSEFEREVQTP
jgi:hypothetical protein